MIIISRKILAIMLTVTMVFSLFGAMPITVSALEEDPTSATVLIADGDLVEDIAGLIEDFLNEDEYDTVIVEGSKTDAEADTLELNIPAGKTVIWDAEYEWEKNGGTGDYAIELTGHGEFVIANGGIVDCTDGGAIKITGANATVIVDGGTVKSDSTWTIFSEASGVIINIGDGGNVANETTYECISLTGTICTVNVEDGIIKGAIKATTVNVDGGKVITNGSSVAITGTIVTVTGNAEITGASAIHSSGGFISNIMINDGKITGTGDGKPAVSTETGQITVEGGTIEAAGAGSHAIYSSDGGVIQVTDGTIEAAGADSHAIYSSNGGMVRVTGGTLKATGTGGFAIYLSGYSVAAYHADIDPDADLSVDVDDDGLIVEVDTLSVPISRDGGDVGLTKKAGDGNFKWDMSGAKPVIKFEFTEDAAKNKNLEWGVKYTPPGPGDNEALDDDDYLLQGYRINNWGLFVEAGGYSLNMLTELFNFPDHSGSSYLSSIDGGATWKNLPSPYSAAKLIGNKPINLVIVPVSKSSTPTLGAEIYFGIIEARPKTSSLKPKYTCIGDDVDRFELVDVTGVLVSDQEGCLIYTMDEAKNPTVFYGFWETIVEVKPVKKKVSIAFAPVIPPISPPVLPAEDVVQRSTPRSALKTYNLGLQSPKAVKIDYNTETIKLTAGMQYRTKKNGVMNWDVDGWIGPLTPEEAKTPISVSDGITDRTSYQFRIPATGPKPSTQIYTIKLLERCLPPSEHGGITIIENKGKFFCNDKELQFKNPSQDKWGKLPANATPGEIILCRCKATKDHAASLPDPVTVKPTSP